MVRNSILLDGSVIGFSSEIVRSYVGERAAAFHLNYVGHSVIGQDTELYGLARTANDKGSANVFSQIGLILVDIGLYSFGISIGKDAKIGARVEILPGRKIGPGVVIELGTPYIEKDIQSGERISRPRLNQ